MDENMPYVISAFLACISFACSLVAKTNFLFVIWSNSRAPRIKKKTNLNRQIQQQQKTADYTFVANKYWKTLHSKPLNTYKHIYHGHNHFTLQGFSKESFFCILPLHNKILTNNKISKKKRFLLLYKKEWRILLK